MWLQGKIKGHQVRIEETIEQWLQNIYSNKPRFTKSFSSRFYQVRDSNVFSEEDQESMNIHENGGDEYIPIQVSVSHNGQIEKINVIWNYNEAVITPEMLTKIILEDNAWPASHEQEVLGILKKGIESHKKFTNAFDSNFEEILCTIELNIVEDGIKLIDKFEWDICEERNNPGEFAKTLVADLSLPRKFENLVAFEIHRQLYSFRKYLSQNNQSMGLETFTRQKKIRGFRENNFLKIPELIRREPTTEATLFRLPKQLEQWGPTVQFLGN